MDTEQRNQILLVVGVIVVILIAVGFIAFGWYQTQVKPLGKTVLQIGDFKFSLGHLERRMRLERSTNTQFQQGGQALLQLPDTVAAQLEREALLLSGSGRLNINVTDEDIDNEIKNQGGLADNAAADLFAAEFKRQVNSTHLQAQEYRQYVRARLTEQRTQAYFLYLAPQSEPQARSRWIVLSDQTAANETLARLDAGEDFGAVAKEVSTDSTSAQQGGEVGWLLRGLSASQDTEDFLFDKANIGDHSGVISANSQFYIVQLEERAVDRPLDDTLKKSAADRDMLKWLSGVRSTVTYSRKLTQDDALRALSDIS